MKDVWECPIKMFSAGYWSSWPHVVWHCRGIILLSAIFLQLFFIACLSLMACPSSERNCIAPHCADLEKSIMFLTSKNFLLRKKQKPKPFTIDAWWTFENWGERTMLSINKHITDFDEIQCCCNKSLLFNSANYICKCICVCCLKFSFFIDNILASFYRLFIKFTDFCLILLTFIDRDIHLLRFWYGARWKQKFLKTRYLIGYKND